MRNTAIALLLALSLSSCKSAKVEPRTTIEETPQLPSSVQMSDAKAAPQLVSGFYDVEDNAWRWTQKEFVVHLGTPPGAAAKGGVLSLGLTIPPVLIQKTGAITLIASIDGTDLQPQTYSRAGSDTYKRDVPANLLSAASVRVNFRLDKVMPPGGGDARELGIVSLSAGLESK